MKIYHSFWATNTDRSILNQNLHDLHELSVLAALESYGNIHLITNREFVHFFEDLPYTSIEIFEDNIWDNEWKYCNFWALGKILAYRQISKKGETFIHIDNDVFLFKRLPHDIENSSIITQELEDDISQRTNYQVGELTSRLNKLYLFENTTTKHAYNLGIFGGSDFESILYFTNEVLKLVLDRENINTLFMEQLYIDSTSCILEQYYLAVCMDRINKKVGYIFDSLEDHRKAESIGYTHLMGTKHRESVMRQVREKIQKIKKPDFSG